MQIHEWNSVELNKIEVFKSQFIVNKYQRYDHIKLELSNSWEKSSWNDCILLKRYKKELDQDKFLIRRKRVIY